jgi:hypothetical protein
MSADIRPIQQPPVEDLRNALQIAGARWTPGALHEDGKESFDAVARLIRAALEKLASPSAGAIRAARTFLELYTMSELHGDDRDCAAAVIHAQLSE